MTKFKLAIATVFLITTSLCTAVSAANIQVKGLQVDFSGEIQLGDAERLIAAMLSSMDEVNKKFYRGAIRIEVNSPGGDVKEALKIAAVVRATYLDINVVPLVNGVCASSCFFIFLAGLERVASGADYVAEWGTSKSLGMVGIHRPYFRSPEGGPTSTKRQEDAMQEIESYLQSQRMPRYLLDEMMSHASNDVYWLKKRDLLAMGSYSAGVEEELIAKCGYNKKTYDNLTIKQFFEYQAESGIGGCVRNHLSKIYKPLRDAAFDKLRKGWRPWKN